MSTLEYINPIRNAIKIFSKERSPRQLAMAVALGMMVGLLPKGNLLAATFTVALLAFRVNLGVGLTTAFVLTLFSPQLDLLTHGIGVRLFNQPAVYSWLTQLHQLPVVAWMSLNNTVVMGSFLLGMALFYPTYHGSELAFEKLLPVLARLRPKTNDEKSANANATSSADMHATATVHPTATMHPTAAMNASVATTPAFAGNAQGEIPPSAIATSNPAWSPSRDSTSGSPAVGEHEAVNQGLAARPSNEFSPPTAAERRAFESRDSTSLPVGLQSRDSTWQAPELQSRDSTSLAPESQSRDSTWMTGEEGVRVGGGLGMSLPRDGVVGGGGGGSGGVIRAGSGVRIDGPTETLPDPMSRAVPRTIEPHRAPTTPSLSHSSHTGPNAPREFVAENIESRRASDPASVAGDVGLQRVHAAGPAMMRGERLGEELPGAGDSAKARDSAGSVTVPGVPADAVESPVRGTQGGPHVPHPMTDRGQVAMRPPLMTRAMLPSRKILDPAVPPVGRPAPDVDAISAVSDAQTPHVQADEGSPNVNRLPEDSVLFSTRSLNTSAGE